MAAIPGWGDGPRRPSLSTVNQGSRSLAVGILAALATAIVYALAAEIVQLTFGLIVVAAVSGCVIGSAVKQRRRLAVALAVGAWMVGILLAFLVSQAVLPQAATPLADRLTLTGLIDYLNGLDIMKLVHPLALAALVFMAWRAAR